jgi:hypothetical protein
MPEINEQDGPVVTENDLESMTEAQLNEFVKNESAKEAPPEPVSEGSKPVETVKKDGEWIEIEVDDPSGVKDKLRFKSQDDVYKSFSHAQSLLRKQKSTIDKYNQERGNEGQSRKELEDAKSQISSLTDHINKLTRGAQQIQLGQSPNQYTKSSLDVLMQQPGNQGNNELALIRQELEELKSLKSELQAQKQAVVIDGAVKGLYSEVKDFTKKHPEYGTAEDFAKLDDIVSTHGEEAAQAMMSPSDWESYNNVMQMVNLYKVDGQGQFDINRKNFEGLEEAYLIHSHRTGSLGNAQAQAKRAGMQAVEGILNRQAQSATTIPNNMSTGEAPEMGDSEADSILSMDIGVIQANPELTTKFRQAFIKATGTDPVQMGLLKPTK